MIPYSAEQPTGGKHEDSPFNTRTSWVQRKAIMATEELACDMCEYLYKQAGNNQREWLKHVQHFHPSGKAQAALVPVNNPRAKASGSP